MTRDLKGKHILITGATDGLGRQVALDLAGRGANILIHGRNQRKAQAVLEEIRGATGNEALSLLSADLASLASVRELAEKVKAAGERLDVLINNAGIGPGPGKGRRETSRDGHELRFAVNYLSHFLLTRRLMSLIYGSAPSRIINVASAGQQAIDFDDVMLEKAYDGLRAYCQSKLAMVMFTFDLAAELEGSGVAVNCLHPATLMPTTMVKETDYFGRSMSSLDEGAQAVEYLAAAPETGSVTGAYFDGKKKARAIAQAYDKSARQRLRELSMQLTELK